MSAEYNYSEHPTNDMHVVSAPILPSLFMGHSDSAASSDTASVSEASTSEKTSAEDTKAVVSKVDVEKNTKDDWHDYLNDELPGKNYPKIVRNLRFAVFTIYHRLFGVVFIVNVAVLINGLARGGFSAADLGKVATANLMCALLMRTEQVVNVFYLALTQMPVSAPLWMRSFSARVFHIGGFHSGCSVSATMWFIYETIQITIDFSNHKFSVLTLVMTWLVLVILFVIIFFAYPSNRLVRHDTFERTHRFLGWLAAALVWVQLVSFINDQRAPGQTLANALLHSPSLWLLVVLTICIPLPWLRLRKVPVQAEVLSMHAVRLHLNHVTPVPGTYSRISLDPLYEWHSFANIPRPDEKGFSLVISRAGDWTGNFIENPPTHVWVRGIPTMGLLKIVPMFKRLVFVATGSGIGPCSPVIFNRTVPIRLLWTAPDVRATFGDHLVDEILEANPDALIWDTRKHGKPDMVKITYRLVREFDAEGVCIISNQSLTEKVVYGMMSRGIPAFGAIWDS